MIGFCVWVFSVVLKKLYVYFEICWKLQNPSHLGVFKCAEYNPGLKKTMKGIFFIILDFVIFTHCRSWSHFQPSGRESSVSTDLMQPAAIQSGCARTVPFKLDTVYSDSPSSLYSFCIYGLLGFFWPAVQLSISSAFRSSCPLTVVFKLDTV